MDFNSLVREIHINKIYVTHKVINILNSNILNSFLADRKVLMHLEWKYLHLSIEKSERMYPILLVLVNLRVVTRRGEEDIINILKYNLNAL